MAYSSDSAVPFNPPMYIGCLFPMDDEQRELEEKQRETWKAWGSDETTVNTPANTAATDAAATSAAPSSSSDYNTELFYETIAFPFLERRLQIRQFDAHATNANAVWPEATFLAEWLTGVHIDLATDNPSCSSFVLAPGEELSQQPQQQQHQPQHPQPQQQPHVQLQQGQPQQPPQPITPNLERLRWLLVDMPPPSLLPTTRLSSPCYHSRLRTRRVIELGAATGALAIYLRLHGVDITTSDLIDDVVTQNIAHNFRLNGLEPQHLAHTWGELLDTLRTQLDTHGYYDVVLGSDILAYEAQFPHLVDTLCVLMPEPSSPHYIGTIMYMCWKRRHKRKTENIFFDLLRERGFAVRMNRQRIYEIKRRTDESASAEAAAAGTGTA